MYLLIAHPERPFKLHVCVGFDPKDISRRLNRNRKKLHMFSRDYFDMHEHDEALTYDLVFSLPGHFVMQFRDYPDIGTLSHEVFHVIAMHMRYVNVPLTKASEEGYAYMFSFLMQKITDEIAKHKAKDI
jgi:hypothetical protein